MNGTIFVGLVHNLANMKTKVKRNYLIITCILLTVYYYLYAEIITCIWNHPWLWKIAEKTFLPESTHTAWEGPTLCHCSISFRQWLWCLSTAWSLCPMCSERHHGAYLQAGTDMPFQGKLQGADNQACWSTCDATSLEFSTGYSWHINKLITVTLGWQEWIIKNDDSWTQGGKYGTILPEQLYSQPPSLRSEILIIKIVFKHLHRAFRTHKMFHMIRNVVANVNKIIKITFHKNDLCASHKQGRKPMGVVNSICKLSSSTPPSWARRKVIYW